MYRILYFTLFCLILSGCIKDSESLNPDKIFELTINNAPIDSTQLLADASLIYTCRLEAYEDVIVDDGKQIAVSVSSGKLSSQSNINNEDGSNLINVTSNGEKAVFYYAPGREAKSNAKMSLTIDNLSQVFDFEILASDPDELLLSTSNISPNIGESIEAVTYLDTEAYAEAEVSSKLRINFQTGTVAGDTIIPYISGPNYSFSRFDLEENLVVAEKKIQTYNGGGTIWVLSSYNDTEGNTIYSDTLYLTFD